MKITLILMLISCGTISFCVESGNDNDDVFRSKRSGSDSYESRRSSTTISKTFEIVQKLKELDSKLEEKVILLQSFIKFNNENIKETILEDLKPEYDKWSNIIHQECIINGQFSIDQLRVLHGLHNIKKIQEINTVLSKLDYELIERFVTIINKLK